MFALQVLFAFMNWWVLIYYYQATFNKYMNYLLETCIVRKFLVLCKVLENKSNYKCNFDKKEKICLVLLSNHFVYRCIHNNIGWMVPLSFLIIKYLNIHSVLVLHGPFIHLSYTCSQWQHHRWSQANSKFSWLPR